MLKSANTQKKKECEKTDFIFVKNCPDFFLFALDRLFLDVKILGLENWDILTSPELFLKRFKSANTQKEY